MANSSSRVYYKINIELQLILNILFQLRDFKINKLIFIILLYNFGHIDQQSILYESL